MGALIIGFGGVPINVQPSITRPTQSPPVGPTPESGDYITNVGV
jgi:hypothetical protein